MHHQCKAGKQYAKFHPKASIFVPHAKTLELKFNCSSRRSSETESSDDFEALFAVLHVVGKKESSRLSYGDVIYVTNAATGKLLKGSRMSSKLKWTTNSVDNNINTKSHFTVTGPGTVGQFVTINRDFQLESVHWKGLIVSLTDDSRKLKLLSRNKINDGLGIVAAASISVSSIPRVKSNNIQAAALKRKDRRKHNVVDENENVGRMRSTFDSSTATTIDELLF